MLVCISKEGAESDEEEGAEIQWWCVSGVAQALASA